MVFIRITLVLLLHSPMDLKDVQENWNRFGEIDPFWAVLAWPGMEEGRWDPEAFFATGRIEIDEVMAYAASLNVDISFGRALDFGCGVGRITRALTSHFQQVHGVDISERMIELARQFCSDGDRCQCHLNLRDDLSLFEDDFFDFIYSNITLQHMPPRFSRRYLLEFLRVLKPGGVMIFQIPAQPRSFGKRLLQPLKATVLWRCYQKLRYGDRPVMNMYGIPSATIQRLISENGGSVIDVRPDKSADAAWISYRYAVQKY
jgi:SAM-dependent methyltransferase